MRTMTFSESTNLVEIKNKNESALENLGSDERHAAIASIPFRSFI